MREFGQIPATLFAAKVICVAIIAIELISFFGTEISAEISPACKEHVAKLWENIVKQSAENATPDDAYRLAQLNHDSLGSQARPQRFSNGLLV
jgi:hypothetical protein